MLAPNERTCRTCKRGPKDGTVVGDDGYCITCHPDGTDANAGILLTAIIHARRRVWDPGWVSVQGGPSGVLWTHPTGWAHGSTHDQLYRRLMSEGINVLGGPDAADGPNLLGTNMVMPPNVVGLKVVEEVKSDADDKTSLWHLVAVTQGGKRPNPRALEWVKFQLAPPAEVLVMPNEAPDVPDWADARFALGGTHSKGRIVALHRPLTEAARQRGSPPRSTLGM